jgi:hypothetical protein
MAAVTDGAWVQEAVELRAQGKSWVEVAQAVGKPRSTVQDAVKRADEAVLEDVYGSGDPGEQIPDPIPGQTNIHEALGEPEVVDEPDPLADFKAEAGEAVGPMPPAPPASETVYVEEIRFDGTTQIALDVGGKRAQTCEVTISGKATVDGFLRKGDRLTAEVDLLVVSAGGHDKLDKSTGIVTESVQKHRAVVMDLRRC